MTSTRRSGRPYAVPVAVALAVAAALGAAGCGPDNSAPEAASAQASPGSPPAQTASRAGSPKPTASPTVPTAPPETTARYVFPIQPASHARFGRVHHDYPATDIFAPCGDIFRAVTAGKVVGVDRVDRWKVSVDSGVTRGGLAVTLLGDDGVRYYGSHLSSIDPAAVAGKRVAMGQPLGRVGRTGSARAAPCHVHFGISPPCSGNDWFNRRGLLFPWSYLESWRANGQLSPVAAVSSYLKTRGCPTGPLTYR